VGRRVGKFEQAHGGTLFLDEIDGMPLAMQGKLLHALQAHEVERLGGTGPIPVDVRIIAAASVDPAALVRAGTFREDLYYRLNVVPLRLPPLRARREDIPLLVSHFLTYYVQRFQSRVHQVSQEAMALLHTYAWPGNVRELEHVIEHLVVATRHEVIRPQDLPWCVRTTSTPLVDRLGVAGYTLSEALQRFEREYIQRSLGETQGNHTAAARMLGIHRNTLLRKLAKWGLQSWVWLPYTAGACLRLLGDA